MMRTFLFSIPVSLDPCAVDELQPGEVYGRPP
jgi:hypothetical protein